MLKIEQIRSSPPVLSVYRLTQQMSWTEQKTNRDHPQCAWPGRCPLSRIRAGTNVRIKALCASEEVSSRLREIGLGEEQIIRLISAQANFICQVCNARLAISSQLAHFILVEPA